MNRSTLFGAATLAVVTAATVPAPGASAQEPPAITVGHKDVSGSRIATGRWRVQFSRVIDGKEQSQSGYFWDIAKASVDGRDALVSVQWSDAANGGHDSTFVDARTLQPLRFHAVNPSDNTTVTFDGLKYTTTHDGKAGAESGEGALEAAAFDGTAVDLAIGSLPLALAYKASIPTALSPSLLKSHGKVDWTKVEVVGEDVTQGKPVWKIDATDARGTRHLMIDKKTRALLDMRLQMPAMGNNPAAELHMVRSPAD